jgi:hypothetical protein
VKIEKYEDYMERKISVTVNDYIPVPVRAEQLGCRIPIGVAILPQNFDSSHKREDLFYGREAISMRILLRQANIVETPIEVSGEKIPEQAHNAFGDWIGPIIFVSYAAYSQNPVLIDLALGVLGNYLTDLFKGLTAQRGVTFGLVIEKENGTCKKIDYQGPVAGLSEVTRIVDKVMKENG